MFLVCALVLVWVFGYYLVNSVDMFDSLFAGNVFAL